MPALLSRTELLERLNTNIVDVYFTKVNGQNRKMRATLDPSHIPGDFNRDHNTRAQRYEPQHSGVLSVFDMEAQEWRAFRIENVHATITPALGEVRTDGKVELD